MDYKDIIQRSLDYIEENLQTDITAQELAQMAQFSFYYYCRLFQQETGFPVKQYILRRRLLHGVYAMKQGSNKTNAALSYGFDTYAGFYRAFCREFGATPSEFLKLCRAKRPYRIDITKEEYMEITHKKAARVLKYWNLDNAPIADIYYEGTGNKNENACYVGENLVLKCTTNLGKLKKHMELSGVLVDIGLLAAVPVPTVNGMDYVQEGEAYYYVTCRLPGKQMVPLNLEEKSLFLGQMIGQLHLALQRIEDCVGEADLLGTIQNWALPKAQTALGLGDDFCKEFLRTFADLYPRLPRQIIHRDPNPGNIICDGTRWGFIDFELAERNVRIYDPCYAATAVLSETFEQSRETWLEILGSIIRGYDGVVGLTKEERSAIPYVILANQFVCVAWFSEQEKFAQIFETNKQMTHWLLQNLDQMKTLLQ